MPRPARTSYKPRPARCKNCGKRFTKTRPHHRFHSPKCRYEFNRNGTVPATQIAKTSEKILAEMTRTIRERLTKLEVRVTGLERGLEV